MFNNKVILVTGGTGSFGKIFVSNLQKKYKPKKIIIFSRDELKQFDMQQIFKQKNMRFFIGDVRDFKRLNLAMQGADYVVHTAALKQVPAAEYNPMECVQTNIYGSQNVIEAALNNKIKRVIALSTDKAANPINLYGATKLAADKIFVSANNIVGKNKTKFSVVRYGNVVGSRGSVVPYFQKLINENSKFLPITDPEMTRFWITLDQGVEFVNKCFTLMKGGEIFVPKIPSVKIVDLADAMGPKLDKKIIGIRPGEKIHEVLCPSDDSHLTHEFNDYFVIAPSFNFFDKKIDFTKNTKCERGVTVKRKFEYNSGSSNKFLSKKQILSINKRVKIEHPLS